MYRALLALSLLTLTLACGDDANDFAGDDIVDQGDSGPRIGNGGRTSSDGGELVADAGTDAAAIEQHDASSDAGQAAPADAGAPDVFLSRVFKEVFQPMQCGLCHPGVDNSVDFTDVMTVRYTIQDSRAIVCNGKPYITPGDPSKSFLYDVISKANPGCDVDRMPQGLDPLSAAQVELVRVWIEQGARR